jgi:hydroxyacylglutathione hydrolase
LAPPWDLGDESRIKTARLARPYTGKEQCRIRRGIAVIYSVIVVSFIMLFGMVHQAGADCSQGESGQFPDKWIDGVNCAHEPQIQVHAYNDSLYILRQSLCSNFEAPFIYLLFGDDKVLMQDTGTGDVDIASVVNGIIGNWLALHNKQSIRLIVTHSHAHLDHILGDPQFRSRPHTTMVEPSREGVQSFFGIRHWPGDIVTYDLGNRLLDVIPIPGHEASHIALYDRKTGILFTGDSLYPGRLYFSSPLFATYRASIQRLVEFTRNKPLCWVLGTHIEMTKTPKKDYLFGATVHRDEHRLELTRDHLVELHHSLQAMQEPPSEKRHDNFIITPRD